MIKKEEMFPMILEVCPSFRVKWQEFEKDWAEEEGDTPYYEALSYLASHLIYLLEIKDCETLKAVFRVVEEWHLQGEPYVKEAATVGLLEDLQNKNLHKTTTPEEFIKYLLPESRKWWTKVENFWEKGEIIKED